MTGNRAVQAMAIIFAPRPVYLHHLTANAREQLRVFLGEDLVLPDVM